MQLLIQKKLDGTIDALEQTILEAHLLTCEQCRLDDREYEKLHSMLKNLPEPQLDKTPLDALWPEIQIIYRKQMNRARKVAKRRMWLRRGVLAALSAVAIVSLVFGGERWLAFFHAPPSVPPEVSLQDTDENASHSKVTASGETAYSTFAQEDLRQHSPTSDSDTLKHSAPLDSVENKRASDLSASVSIHSDASTVPSNTKGTSLFQTDGPYTLALNKDSVQLFLMTDEPSSVADTSTPAKDDRGFSITSHDADPATSTSMSSFNVLSVNEPSANDPSIPPQQDTAPRSPAYVGPTLLWEERFPETSTDHQLTWLDDQTFQVSYRLDGSTWIQIFTIDPVQHKVQKKVEKRQ